MLTFLLFVYIHISSLEAYSVVGSSRSARKKDPVFPFLQHIFRHKRGGNKVRKEPLNILLVDDDERFQKMEKNLLEGDGFRVFSASTAHEALRTVRNEKIDVVVLDLKLPDGDGNQVLRDMKMIKPDIPVIILTGYGTIQSAFLAFDDDAVDYLTKPCSIGVLSECIHKAVERKSGTRARWHTMWAESELKGGFS